MSRSYQDRVYHAPSQVRDRHEQVIELIRQNPGISKGQLAKLLYANKNTTDESTRLGSMLTHLCFKGRIKYQEVHRYTVIDAE